MDTQTLTPNSSGPFSTMPSGGNTGGNLGSPGIGGGGGGRSPILLVLVIILGLGTIIFGILTVTFSSKATTVSKQAASAKAEAVKAAQEAQKKIDDEANAKANESPYRAYVAPTRFGSFVINFPKNWSSYVDEEASSTQVNLILNPEFIRRTDGREAPVAIKVALYDTPKDRFFGSLNNAIKTGKVSQADITVSSQPGFDLTGALPDRRSVRMVVIPIRDKVLVFTSEDTKYNDQLNQVLAQAKIIP